MFAFTWLLGLGLWVVYIICGLFTVIFYTMFFAKKTFRVIKGDFKKNGVGNYYYFKDGKEYNRINIDKFDCYLIISLTFFFWPLAILLLILAGIFLLLFRYLSILIMDALKKLTKIIPNIKIEKNKTEV